MWQMMKWRRNIPNNAARIIFPYWNDQKNAINRLQPCNKTPTIILNILIRKIEKKMCIIISWINSLGIIYRPPDCSKTLTEILHIDMMIEYGPDVIKSFLGRG